jgi:hypothetical protein
MFYPTRTIQKPKTLREAVILTLNGIAAGLPKKIQGVFIR